MITTVQKWGNSLGIRIPKVFLEAASIREKDKVELQQDGEIISIRKITPAVHQSLEDRLVKFYGKPIDMIAAEPIAEYDWGSSKGDEIW